jgi:outer membrane receptor protein involved in Fe transport
MPLQPARLTLLAALLAPSALLAQTAAPAAAPVKAAKPKQPESGDAKTVPTVEVKGSASAYDPRRDDTASKTVLSTEEIQKYGDTNVFDVLKRAPGVTITNGNQIRMRGLSGGYTQILVNGDRPPPGFSLDNLTPDQIERIEVIRSASAEYSMQSIAGTINIVLRKLVSKPQRDLRFNANRSPITRGGVVSGTYAEKRDNLSYFLNGAMWAGHNDSSSFGNDQFHSPSGALTQARESAYHGDGSYAGFVFFPRVAMKLENGDELNLQAGLQAGHSRWGGASHNDNLVGSFGNPDYIDSTSATPGRQQMVRGEVNWVRKLAGGKLDVSANAERSRNSNDAQSDLYTDARARHLYRDWDTDTHISRYGLRGKFTRSLFDDHALTSGLEASTQRNDEVRDRREQLNGDAPTDIVEHFEPQITRLAGYVQDEWSINKQLSVYVGARWEGVQTDSEGTGLADTHSRNHVLSPVAQALYKLPGASGRQLRVALTRTYKAPTIEQLTAKRYEAAENTRFSPDSSGNPDLRPELANGIDVGYEHFWAPGALFAVNASRRTITDYIRTRLDQDAQGRWLYQPLNDGTADVRSLEAELKLPLAVVSAFASGFDVRASVTRNWSHVSTVPGPNNRLDAQVPLSSNVGVDYKKGNLGMGVSLAYQEGGWVQVSEAQSQRQMTRRDLDAYALWKLDQHLQLRVSLANILGTDNTSERLYADESGLSRQASWQPGYMRTGVNLEMKF